MIGKNKTTNSTEVTKTKVGTLIGQGAVFNGDFTAPETIRVDGKIQGDCTCKENLILGEQGEIIGDVTAQNIIISGMIEGDVIVSGKMEILSTGKLTGNITARSLVIDEDAYFDGRCNMMASPKEDSLKSTEKNDAKKLLKEKK